MSSSITFINAEGKLASVSAQNPLPTSGGGGGGGGGGSTDITTLAKEATLASAVTALATANVRAADIMASGVITTQNLVTTGVATANSAVVIDVGGRDTLGIQTVGTYTGILSVQGTMNGTTWVTLSGAAQLLSLATGAQSATIASGAQNIYQFGVGAFAQVRVTALAAVTGSVTVTLRAVDGNSLIALDAGIPAGSQAIGTVGVTGVVAATTTPVATGSALSVVTAATTNGSLVKAGTGILSELTISNVTAATINVKIYNKATAPTVGTDVPIMTIPVPAKEFISYNFGAIGKRFALGLGLAVTAGAAATDTAAVTAGAQISGTYL